MEMSRQLHAPAALPKEKDSGTHCKGGWVGPRGGLDEVAKNYFPVPAGNRTSAVWDWNTWVVYIRNV
jgi:hypothetical protein